MTVQLSTTVRNAAANTIEGAVGTAPTLELRTGAQPADCATASTGTLIASMTLPADWLDVAASGACPKLGTWSDLSADNAGTIGYFRIIKSGTCHVQGSVTATVGGGDMTVDNPVVVATQEIVVTSFSIGYGGA